ncbi:5-hydroxyisourate hydrolase-like isoform X3 [Mugil cephalus]|nr:5-hydroxyisourate hydrolase-like isoform X3 [Mugil cephalus]XP_047436857.1 5-hydroxyisourate hydrolase-like isoform X3 [Mugil cephalus]
MAGSPSPLTTHVLNIAMGTPGSNMALSLYQQDPSTSAWDLITTGTTNNDGRCPGLITQQLFTPGVYKLHFDTAQYWASMGETSFYPYVEHIQRELEIKCDEPIHCLTHRRKRQPQQQQCSI